jgi:NADH-quinone oxidoreductase subunit M
MKRIIAYSSFSHVGLMVAGTFASAVITLRGTFNIEGAEGALVQTFAHGINVVGLFYCCDILYKRFKSRDIRQMGGLAKVAPKFAVLFLIIILGSMGVPLTNGFIGEFILLKSVYDFNGLAAVIAGLTVILCAVYLLRFYGKAMFGQGDDAVLSTVKDLSAVEFSVLASLAVFVIVLGIFPQPLIEMVNSSLKFIYQSMVS